MTAVMAMRAGEMAVEMAEVVKVEEATAVAVMAQQSK